MTTRRAHSYAKHFHKENTVEIDGFDAAYRTLMRHNSSMMEEKAQLLQALKFLTVYEMVLRQKFGATKDTDHYSRLADRVELLSKLEDRSDYINVGIVVQQHVESYYNVDERREVFDLMEIVEQC